MRGYKAKLSMLSLSAIMALGLVGCGGGGSDGTTNNTGSTSTTVTGTGSDGYLVYSTVCLDLNKDGYCQIGTEPATSTDVNGSFTFTITPEQKADANYATAPLVIYGGYDKDTGTDFSGKLLSTFDDTNSAMTVNVSPVTTMVHAVATENNISVEAAKTIVAKVLNINESKLDADPVKLAKDGDKSVYVAALQLQKSVNILAQAAKDTNASVKVSDEAAKLYANIAKNLSADDNLTAAIQTATTDNATKTRIEKTVTVIATMAEDTNSTALLGAQADAVETDLLDMNDSDVGSFESNDITSKTFAMIRANAILKATGLSTPTTTVIANVLSTETKKNILTPAQEIALLKADTSTAAIGSAYETFINGLKTKADDIKLVADASGSFAVGMNMYDFWTNGENNTIIAEKNTLASNGTLSSEDTQFDVNSSTFIPYTDTDFQLINGVWKSMSEIHPTYTLSSDKNVLSISTFGDVKILKVIDLPTATAADKQYLIDNGYNDTPEFIANLSSSDFTSGAKAYVVANTNPGEYDIWDYVGSWGGKTFSDLQSFINDYKQTKTWFYAKQTNGNYNIGLGFANDGLKTLTEGVSGSVIEFSFDSNGTVTNKVDAGTWKVVKLPNTDSLAVLADIKPEYIKKYGMDNAQRLFTVYNGKVYEGSYYYNNDYSDKGVMFNETAADDIKSYVKEHFGTGTTSSGGLETSSLDLSGYQHVYIEKNKATASDAAFTASDQIHIEEVSSDVTCESVGFSTYLGESPDGKWKSYKNGENSCSERDSFETQYSGNKNIVIYYNNVQ